MPWLAQNAVFQKLASIADVTSLSKQERMAYDENLRIYRDTIAVMEGQYQDGMEKGRAEERLANARSLVSNGVPMDVIVKSLGLTPKEIEVLSRK